MISGKYRHATTVRIPNLGGHCAHLLTNTATTGGKMLTPVYSAR
jgi:hypothetical protein